MHFFYKIHIDTFFYFGSIIFFSLIIGEIISRTKFLPRISAYMLVGFLCGPNMLKLINQVRLVEIKILSDISLGLILFSLGKHLDFTWLRYDRGLLYGALTEFTLTVTSIAIFVKLLGWSLLSGVFAGIIAATTSPAVLLTVARDLSSEGPVTRRSMIITSINNFLAITVFAILLPFAKSKGYVFSNALLYSAYRFVGSLCLSFFCFKVMESIASKLIKTQKELQFILLMSVIVLAISISKMFNLPNMLVLLSMGIAVRNFDKKHIFIEIDFGWTAHLFFIPLFFITGCYINFTDFVSTPFIIITFILIRIITKTIGITLFTKKSSLTYKQSLAIAAAITPMTGIAIGITNKVLYYNQDIGNKLLTIISAVITILGIFGPIITQAAFKLAEETFEKIN